MKSLKVCLICFLTFHYLTPFFFLFSYVSSCLNLSLRTLDVGEGRMGCYCSFLFIILFISLLIYLNVLIIVFLIFAIFFFFWSTPMRTRHVDVSSLSLLWPCGSLTLLDPATDGVKCRTSSVKVSFLCCVVNVLLMHLGFCSKICIIFFNT